MIYSNKDKIFFKIILDNCSKTYEEVIDESLKYKLVLTEEILDFKTDKIKMIDKNNKTSYKKIIPFGFYDNNKTKFVWYKVLKNDFYNHLINSGIKQVFNTLTTIDKLFLNEAKIDKENHNVIPYLIAIFNPNYNVIRFQQNGFMIYALVELNITDNLDFDKFVNNAFIYNIATGIKKH